MFKTDYFAGFLSSNYIAAQHSCTY